MSLIQKPVAIVLGGTNPHKALIQELKERGYYTVLIDYLENPPAKSAANKHIQESTLDKKKVLEIAQNFNASFVVSICVDQANVIACYVAEKLGLPIPYSYKTAMAASNKLLMKKRMKDYNIPTSDFIEIKEFQNLDSIDLTFPVVVKPSDTTGSKGVKKASTFEEAILYAKEARRLSRSNSVLIEEFKLGEEIQIDCFVQKKKVSILMLNKKNKVMLSRGMELQSIGSFISPTISAVAYNKIIETANRIVDIFKFDNTPFFIQTIVNKDDVNVIEFAPRMGGGLSYRIINLYSSCNSLNHALNFYTKQQTEINYTKSKYFFSTNNIYTEKGNYGRIEGIEKLIDNQVILEYYSYKTENSVIGSELSSNNRVGAFIVMAKNKNELLTKMKKAFDTIKIFDTENNILQLKNLYEFK